MRLDYDDGDEPRGPETETTEEYGSGLGPTFIFVGLLIGAAIMTILGG